MRSLVGELDVSSLRELLLSARRALGLLTCSIVRKLDQNSRFITNWTGYSSNSSEVPDLVRCQLPQTSFSPTSVAQVYSVVSSLSTLPVSSRCGSSWSWGLVPALEEERRHNLALLTI